MENVYVSLGKQQLQTKKQHSCNTIIKQLNSIVFTECIDSRCLCECEKKTVGKKTYKRCNIIKNEPIF